MSLGRKSQVELAKILTPNKTDNCVDHFPLTNTLPQCGMMASMLLRNGFITFFQIDDVHCLCSWSLARRIN